MSVVCDSEWVPSEADNPFRDFRWWYSGVSSPSSGLQVDGYRPPKRLLGPDGRPAPRRVHGFGFRSEMVVDEDS
jgi:hypothetical protein